MNQVSQKLGASPRLTWIPAFWIKPAREGRMLEGRVVALYAIINITRNFKARVLASHAAAGDRKESDSELIWWRGRIQRMVRDACSPAHPK